MVLASVPWTLVDFSAGGQVVLNFVAMGGEAHQAFGALDAVSVSVPEPASAALAAVAAVALTGLGIARARS